MDGYPRDYENAKNVFVITPKPKEKKMMTNEEGEEVPVEEEEGEGEQQDLKPKLQTNIYPESVISIQATELFLKRRSKELLKN